IGPHPAAPEPEPHTTFASGPRDAEPRQATPTVRVLYSEVQDDQAPKVDLTDPNELDQSCDVEEPTVDAPAAEPDRAQGAPRDAASAAGTIIPEERLLEMLEALERPPRPNARQ